MTFVIDGYVARVRCGRKGKNKPSLSSRSRNWWLGKERIQLGNVKIPEEYRGKRIRFKIEILEDKPPTKTKNQMNHSVRRGEF